MVRASIDDICEDELYCTPEQVMDAMGIVDQYTQQILKPSDADIQNRKEIIFRIMAKMNEIDMLTKDSWREHKVKDQIYTINTYWRDNSSLRINYWRNGGWFIELTPNVREWNICKGDKLYKRSPGNTWRDISKSVKTIDNPGGVNWFDYERGKLYLNGLPWSYTENAIKITYRYGKTDPVPFDIQRCCALMTGISLIQNQWYVTKIGTGGDLSSILNNNIKDMQKEVDMILRQHQRYGAVYSLYG